MPYETPDQLLQDTQLSAILQETAVLPDVELPDLESKIAIMAHLSRKYDEPVPSNALDAMHSANDIVRWYSERLKPVGAQPHARRFIRNVFADGVLDADEMARLDSRIDLDRQTMQEELVATLPPNLELDPSTFRKSTPEGLAPRRPPIPKSVLNERRLKKEKKRYFRKALYR